MMNKDSIKTSNFYRKDISKFEILDMKKAKQNASRWKNEEKRMPQRLMGPTQFWRQFRKQADALEVAAMFSTKNEMLCTFVHQKEDGFREFIVAHPEVYWHYDKFKPPEERCSYEVIPEGSPSRLYFDLEFQTELNPESDGRKMTETLVNIFCAYLLKYYDLPCSEKNVVNLDSTRNQKFSRHLIFTTKDIAFRSNLDVGRLVKSVCREIEDYLENSSAYHDILSHYERKDLQALFVMTEKKRKIFVDTGVYTRNRHFRIYKSTKWGKLSNLTVAPESVHEPLEERRDKELGIFLDSLISYFPNKKDLYLLHMHEDDHFYAKNYAKSPSEAANNHRSDISSHSSLDKFILSLVTPGKIRVSKQLQKTIIYEIIGHRYDFYRIQESLEIIRALRSDQRASKLKKRKTYCANIGRQHKSNNVYWIANLLEKIVYQKCHDEDCAEFASKPIPIPDEVSFQLADEFDDLLLELSEPEGI